jgi:hypothetical protein
MGRNEASGDIPMNNERLREVAQFAQEHAEQITNMHEWDGCPWGLLAKAGKYGLSWDAEKLLPVLLQVGGERLRGWSAIALVLDTTRWDAGTLFGGDHSYDDMAVGKKAADEITRRVERRILNAADEQGAVQE